MKRINLDYLLTEQEILDFENKYEEVKKLNLDSNGRTWKFWGLMANWAGNLENSRLLLEELVGNQQADILKAYKNVLYPLEKKGLVLTPILGTNLGFYRNNSMIFHDDDLDLGIDIFQYRKYKTRIWLRSILNGWSFGQVGWFKRNFKPPKKNIVAKMYKKGRKYQIGNYKFSMNTSIDLWPIARVPDLKTIENDRINYQLHIYNLLVNYGGFKFRTPDFMRKRFSNIEEKEFLDSILNSKISEIDSRNWIREFILRAKNSNSEIYLALEKDMYKIPIFKYNRMNRVNINDCDFNMPVVNDSYFEEMYGDWKKQVFTHLHAIRFNSVKKVNKRK